MKNLKHPTRLIFTLCFLAFSRLGFSQTCPASFTFTYGLNGAVLFSAIGSSSISATTTHNWNFGDGAGVALTGTTGVNTTHSYTLNGTYTVSLININTAVSCTSPAVTQTVQINNAPCFLNITYSAPGNANLCTGTATVNAVNMCGAPSFTWSNGVNSSTISGLCPGNTYTVNATSSGTSCCTLAVGSVFIPTCNVTAQFTSTLSCCAAGTMSFTSTSAGVGAGGIYVWDFGDFSAPFSTSLTTVIHNYPYFSPYLVKLKVTSALGCADTVTNPAVVPCNLNASFISNNSSGGVVNFISTSTNTFANSNYTWLFGAGSNSFSGVGLIQTVNTFTAAGNYSVTLFVSNMLMGSCKDSVTQIVTVPNCSLITASFVHTVGVNGLVNFNNASSGTNTTTNYLWDFGDGVYSTVISPIHTYLIAGAYNVALIVNHQGCSDTAIFSVNVTGIPCVANAGFSLSPATTPQNWNATPNYPWNVTNARWFWGDGSFGNGLYTSHTYSVAGNYNICLTVTVSCGLKDSVCSSYNVFKIQEMLDEKSIIYINVKKPGLVTSLDKEEFADFNLSLYPNPNNGQFNLKINNSGSDYVTITIYNLMSEVVYVRELIMSGDTTEELVELNEVSNGVYIVRAYAGGKTIIKKIILDK